MTLLLRFRLVWLGVALAVVNAIHPFIHGTPLDSGCLDAVLPYLDALYVNLHSEID